MNVKIRALLWEECRVGGAIAAACTAVGILMQLIIFLTSGGLDGTPRWSFVGDSVLLAALGIPVLTALLLALNLANSGHLEGGFSRRLLRLPIELPKTLLVVLSTRLFAVLAVASVSIAVGHALFHHGPGARFVVLVALVYLFIQFLDWLRAVAALLVPAIVLLAAGLLFTYAGRVSTWDEALLAPGGIGAGLAASFAVCVVLLYLVSLRLIQWTRCGERLALFSLPSLDVTLTLPGAGRRKPFASPERAQIWFESRRMGWTLPAATLAFWALGATVMWLIKYSDFLEDRHHTSPVCFFDSFWLFDVLPFVALLLAAFVWALRVSASTGARGRKRTTGFVLRQPLDKATIMQARFLATAMHLAPVLFAVALVSTLSFLFSDHGQVAILLGGALERGDVSLRETAAILAGPMVLIGLVAWGVMTLGGATATWIVGMAVLFCIAVLAGLSPLAGFESSWNQNCLLSISWLALLMPTVLLAATWIVTLRYGMMSRRASATSLLLWAAFVFVFFTSYGPVHGSELAAALFVSFAFGALPIVPYICGMLFSFSRGLREPLTREVEPYRPRASARARLAVAIILAVGVAVFLWLRWPGEPQWCKTWHARGLPTSLQELNDSYASVPEAQNLAQRYLDTKEHLASLDGRWRQEVVKQVGGSADSFFWDDVNDALMYLGNAEVERTQPIPADVWRWSKLYWDTVGVEIAPELHAAAQSGLTSTRYPADLRLGFNVRLDYLSRLRELSRWLRLEAIIAAVERRPEAATEAILDILPIGDSLGNEPVLISELVRMALYGISYGALEEVMNRVSLPEEDLARIQERFARTFPPSSDKPFMNHAMLGEELLILDGITSHPWEVARTKHSLLSSLGRSIVIPLRAMLGFAEFDRTVAMSWMAEIIESEGYVPNPTNSSHAFPSDDMITARIYTRATLSCILLPALGRAYESEWRVRTMFDMARTAVAVERFRRAEGRLPERLDMLVPRFLDAVPQDPWNENRPLTYRIREDGEFVVYSFASNGKDDLGLTPEHGNFWYDGDMTFTVAPPAIRDRPQVAEGPGEAL